MADCKRCINKGNLGKCVRCINSCNFETVKKEDLWNEVISDMNSEKITESKMDYEAEYERLVNKMWMLREENFALTKAVKELSVALEMSKKLNS